MKSKIYVLEWYNRNTKTWEVEYSNKDRKEVENFFENDTGVVHKYRIATYTLDSVENLEEE